MPREYRIIARVAKPHGKRGEVVAEPVDGLPPLLAPGMRVALVPPLLRRDRWHEVLRADEGERAQLVSLSGVRDIGHAEELAGSYVLAAVDELPEDLALYDEGWLIGREVVDEAFGPLGTIAELLRGPANDAWVIEGPRGELIVPVVEHLVGELPDEGPILIHARREDLVGLADDPAEPEGGADAR